MIDKTFRAEDYRLTVLCDKVIFGVQKDDRKHPVTNIQFPVEDLNMMRGLFSEAINYITEEERVFYD